MKTAEFARSLGLAPPEPFTRENVLSRLKAAVEYGFTAALNRRGISASLWHYEVLAWNRVLEEGLEEFDTYPNYGLPVFRATTVKYGFDNHIGDDTGCEWRYADNWDD